MINRVILIGRLVADPEAKYTQSGLAVCNFRLAVERNFKNAEGEKETDFINCVAWRKTAELIAEYCKKGHLIGVDGSLQMRRYETREGEKRTTYEVQCDSVQFLESKGFKGSGVGESREQIPPDNYAEMDQDLPF